MSTPAENADLRTRITEMARQPSVSPTDTCLQLCWRRNVEQSFVEGEALRHQPETINDRSDQAQFEHLFRLRESHKTQLTKIRKEIAKQSEQIRALETLSRRMKASRRQTQHLQEIGYYTYVGLSYCFAQNILNNPAYDPYPANAAGTEPGATKKEE